MTREREGRGGEGDWSLRALVKGRQWKECKERWHTSHYKSGHRCARATHSPNQRRTAFYKFFRLRWLGATFLAYHTCCQHRERNLQQACAYATQGEAPVSMCTAVNSELSHASKSISHHIIPQSNSKKWLPRTRNCSGNSIRTHPQWNHISKSQCSA